MSDPSRTSRTLAPGMLILGACTAWLVLQNMLLALGLLWLAPQKAATLAALVVKAAVQVLHG